MIKVFLLIGILFCCGCAKNVETIYVDRPIEIAVPVTVYPYIEEIECPRLPIHNITKDTPRTKVAEYYVQSIKIQKTCLEIYKKTIEEINKKATKKK